MCRLVAEQSNLRLVGGNNDGDDGSTWLFRFQDLLNHKPDVSCDEYVTKNEYDLPVSPTTNSQCAFHDTPAWSWQNRDSVARE